MSSSLKSSVGPFPFGGSSGSRWDDKKHNGVKTIKIVCGVLVYSREVIYSMTVEYVDNDTSTWATKHGGDGGSKTYTVSLDYPDEYLISVSGSYTSTLYDSTMTSLSFESNKRKFGPFGNEIGTKFSSPSSGAKIVGFHGKSSTVLDALGAHLEFTSVPLTLANSVKAEGGQGGSNWDDGSSYAAVRKIEIWYGGAIDSIRFEYDSNGTPVWSKTRGGDTKINLYTVKLAYPNEYLVSVSGYIRETPLPVIIQSLTFVSNKGTYGPIGPEKGKKFTVSAQGEKIIGFHGKSGLNLDAIGIYTVPIPKDITPSIPVDSVGPFGGEGGKTWDDGVHEGIKSITIGLDQEVDTIQYLRTHYVKDGKSVVTDLHGRAQDANPIEIKLDYPDEFLVKVTGYHDILTGFTTSLVQALTLETNKGTYGPYGTETGTEFSLGKTNSKILGLHGRADTYLDAIGAHLSPIKDN